MIVLEKKTSWLAALLMFRGSTFQRTWPRIFVVVLIALAVTAAREEGILGPEVDLTPTPFSLIGLALGIFLGFRNNTAYDRFWEGRKLWGRVVNTSRSITRQILTLTGAADQSVDYRSIASREAGAERHVPEEIIEWHHDNVHRVIAYVHALRLHLRSQDRLEELEAYLPQAEVEALRDESNRPIALLQRIGAEFRFAYDKGWVHAMHLPVLEASLTEFANVQGGCERIRATPIPFSYNILLHRIVAFYCLLLPFGLVGTVHYLTPIVAFIVSYAFFGLDAVGDEIEDPFGEDLNDLPLSAITRMIEVNLRERLGEDSLPPLLKPKNHVLS